MKNQKFQNALRFLKKEKVGRNSVLKNLLIKKENRLNPQTGVFQAIMEDMPEILHIYTTRNKWLKDKGKLYFYGRGVREHYRNIIKNHGFLWCYKDNGKVLGTAIIRPYDNWKIWPQEMRKDTNAVYLTDLFTSIESEGHGVAGKLMNGLADVAEKMGFDAIRGSVVNNNEALMNHYQKIFGYEIKGHVEIEGQDHTLMQKTFDGHITEKWNIFFDNSLNENIGGALHKQKASGLESDALNVSKPVFFQDEYAQKWIQSVLEKDEVLMSDLAEFKTIPLDNSRLYSKIESLTELKYFQGLESLKGLEKFVHLNEVSLPKSITKITSHFPSSLEKIEFADIKYTFDENGGAFCSPLDVTLWFHSLPDGIVQIGQSAWKIKGELSDFKIEDENIYINPKILDSRKIDRVNLPKQYYTDDFEPADVVDFLEYAISIENIIVDKDCPKYSAYKNGLYSKDFSTLYLAINNSNDEFVMHPETEVISKYALQNLRNVRTFKFSDKIKEISEYTFYAGYHKNITNIILPKNLEKIGEGAFYRLSLTDIKLPKTLKEIGKRAFAECSNLERIEIPESVETIGIGAFFKCQKLSEIVLPKNIVHIPEDCFGASSITELNLHNYSKLESIGSLAFANCPNLQKVDLRGTLVTELVSTFVNDEDLITCHLPENVSVLHRTFYKCRNFEMESFPEKAIKLIDAPFFACPKIHFYYETIPSFLAESLNLVLNDRDISLISHFSPLCGFHFKKVEAIPNKFGTIKEGVYNGMKIDELIVPEGVKTISAGSFKSCQIRKALFPSTLTSVGADAIGVISTGYRTSTNMNQIDSASNLYFKKTKKLIDFPHKKYESCVTDFAYIYFDATNLKNYQTSARFQYCFNRSSLNEWDGVYPEELKDKKLIGSQPFKIHFGQRVFSERTDIDWIVSHYKDKVNRSLHVKDGAIDVSNTPTFSDYFKTFSSIGECNFVFYEPIRCLPNKKSAIRTPIDKTIPQIKMDLMNIPRNRKSVLEYFQSILQYEGNEDANCYVSYYDTKEMWIEFTYTYEGATMPRTNNTFVRILFDGTPSPKFEDKVISKHCQDFYSNLEKELKTKSKEMDVYKKEHIKQFTKMFNALQKKRKNNKAAGTMSERCNFDFDLILNEQIEHSTKGTSSFDFDTRVEGLEKLANYNDLSKRVQDYCEGKDNIEVLIRHSNYPFNPKPFSLHKIKLVVWDDIDIEINPAYIGNYSGIVPSEKRCLEDYGLVAVDAEFYGFRNYRPEYICISYNFETEKFEYSTSTNPIKKFIDVADSWKYIKHLIDELETTNEKEFKAQLRKAANANYDFINKANVAK